MSAGTSERTGRGGRSERSQRGGGDRSKGGDRSQGGDRGGDRGQRGDRSDRSERIEGELSENIVKIKRCAAVVKGGRRFSFAAMVVVGDGKGKVGWGYGKANEVPPSVEKARKEGMRSLVTVTLDGSTIAHTVQGRYGAAHVVLLPAAPGAGVIAGSAVRAVCEAAGIHDILTKSFGSNNPVSLVKATFAALKQLRPKTDVERLRGVPLT
jgi:small subunit ribosomal protein S5